MLREDDREARVGREGRGDATHMYRQIGTYLVHVDGNLLELAHAVAHPRQLDLLLCSK